MKKELKYQLDQFRRFIRLLQNHVDELEASLQQEDCVQVIVITTEPDYGHGGDNWYSPPEEI